MKRALLILLSIATPLGCAFLGMLVILLSNPEVTIDEGWRLGWIGLSRGLAVGCALVWASWQHRRAKHRRGLR